MVAQTLKVPNYLVVWFVACRKIPPPPRRVSRSTHARSSADADGADATVGPRPLYLAAEGGHLEIARALLRARAGIGADKNGRLPSARARDSGHEEIAELLESLERRQKPDTRAGDASAALGRLERELAEPLPDRDELRFV